VETAHGRFCAHYWMGAALPVNAYHVSEVQAHRGDTVVDVRFDVYGQHLRSMTITTQALIMHYGNQCPGSADNINAFQEHFPNCPTLESSNAVRDYIVARIRERGVAEKVFLTCSKVS